MKKENLEILDFVAIGLGPFNLSLACLTDDIQDIKGVFLEKRKSFDWHPGMMLEDTTLQVPFMADLVTLADPTNKFSFLNYVKLSGRIYSFYIKENFLLLRKEYNHYCQWACSQLETIKFGTEVINIDYIEEEGLYVVSCQSTEDHKLSFYKTKKLVFGTGTEPFLPTCASDLSREVSHTASYLRDKSAIQKTKSVTVVGSGQSAAEVYADLLQEIDSQEYKLSWITRSPRFFPLEYSKLTLEMTSPEYVDYFHNLDADKRDELNTSQKNLYKGINQDLIGEIFDTLYSKNLLNDVKAELRTNSELIDIKKSASGGYELTFHQHEQDKYYRHHTDRVIFATGYRARQPKFLEGILNRINWDKKDRYDVHRNYSIDVNRNEIFVQNAELHTHGFVTPDLGMGAYRNAQIINSILGKEHYTVERKIAFQQFEVSEEEEIPRDEIEILQQETRLL